MLVKSPYLSVYFCGYGFFHLCRCTVNRSLRRDCWLRVSKAVNDKVSYPFHFITPHAKC